MHYFAVNFYKYFIKSISYEFRRPSLGYYAQLTALSHIMGLQAGAHYTLAAGTGTFGYEPNVSYFFGFPRAITPGGVVLTYH